MSLSTGAEIQRSNRRFRKYTLEEALGRPYYIRTNQYVYLPLALRGHRVRLVLADDEKGECEYL